MEPNAARVSIVTIFLDAERFLDEAISSIYAQTYDAWELFLVDDGSTDASTRMAQRYASLDPARVRYLEHANHENRGMSVSRNLGVAASRGDFIAFLDADDVWLPGRLERSVALLNAHPEADMVYGKTEYWYSWSGEQGTQTDRVQAHGFRANRVVRAPELLIKYLMTEAALPCINSLTLRRHAVRGSGGIPEDFPGLYEDQALLARFCLHHDVFVADEVWDRYRQHPASVCAVAERDGTSAAARRHYLSWLETELSRQAMDGTRVWDALRFAKRTEKYARPGLRARVARALLRLSTRIKIATRLPRRSPGDDSMASPHPPTATQGAVSMPRERRDGGTVSASDSHAPSTAEE